MWHVINNWYSSSLGIVLWDCQRSEAFEIKQGVRQGGILSPFLYCLFVDELLDLLAASGYGVTINNIFCGAPMYADDISLIAKSPGCLQAMLDIHVACEYARKWRYQLNSVNSLVMVMGESAVTRLRERLRRVWKLGNSIVCEIDEQHHLEIL